MDPEFHIPQSGFREFDAFCLWGWEDVSSQLHFRILICTTWLSDCTRSPPLFFPVCWGAKGRQWTFTAWWVKPLKGVHIYQRERFFEILQWQHEINFYKTNKLGKNEEGCSEKWPQVIARSLKCLLNHQRKIALPPGWL